MSNKRKERQLSRQLPTIQTRDKLNRDAQRHDRERATNPHALSLSRTESLTAFHQVGQHNGTSEPKNLHRLDYVEGHHGSFHLQKSSRRTCPTRPQRFRHLRRILGHRGIRDSIPQNTSQLTWSDPSLELQLLNKPNANHHGGKGRNYIPKDSRSYHKLLSYLVGIMNIEIRCSYFVFQELWKSVVECKLWLGKM